jgi:hypothetical protein
MGERIAALIAAADRDCLLELLTRVYGAGVADGVGVPPPDITPSDLAALLPQVRERHWRGQATDRTTIHRQARPPATWPEDPDR